MNEKPTGTALPTVIVITGTDTEVGKTVATAAIAAVLMDAGLSTTAYKPVQTGVAPGEPGDMSEIHRLSDTTTTEGCRFREPAAPRLAASLEDARLPTLDDHLATIARLSSTHDHVLVEGAGGLLVELTDAGQTLADLAAALPDAGVVLVARSALGTLNHTMLTQEALSHRDIRLLGTIIGSWPQDPTVIETSNRDYTTALPEGVLGAIPTGAPGLAPENFRTAAPSWLRNMTERHTTEVVCRAAGTQT